MFRIGKKLGVYVYMTFQNTKASCITHFFILRFIYIRRNDTKNYGNHNQSRQNRFWHVSEPSSTFDIEM